MAQWLRALTAPAERASRFSSQCLFGGSQLTVTPVPEHPVFSSVLCGHCTCMHGTHKFMGISMHMVHLVSCRHIDNKCIFNNPIEVLVPMILAHFRSWVRSIRSSRPALGIRLCLNINKYSHFLTPYGIFYGLVYLVYLINIV